MAEERLRIFREEREAQQKKENEEFGNIGPQPVPTEQSTSSNNKKKEQSQYANVQEILGFMPKRGDFEQEYDQDADLLLADMEFFEDDTKDDIKLKNDVIDLYNARLDERIRRKKFVVERGLLDIKKIQKFERKRTKEERDIISHMKMFARFHSAEAHEKLVNSLIKERMLREVIEQLKFFKQQGLTTLDDIEKYIEGQKKKTTNGVQQNFAATEQFMNLEGDSVAEKLVNALDQPGDSDKGSKSMFVISS